MQLFHRLLVPPGSVFSRREHPTRLAAVGELVIEQTGSETSPKQTNQEDVMATAFTMEVERFKEDQWRTVSSHTYEPTK